MDKQKVQNVFSELTERDDLEGINNLFAAEGWSVYDNLVGTWFRQGVQMNIAGESISRCWNNHQRRGHKAHTVVMSTVAKIWAVS